MSSVPVPIPKHFTAWVASHGEAFGWTENDIRTAYTWWPAWARFAPHELAAATEELLTTAGVPRYADRQRDYIVATIDRLRKQRSELARRNDGLTHSRPASEAERREIRLALRRAGLVTTPLTQEQPK